MDNLIILEYLERQRDSLFQRLNATSISGLHQAQYEDIKAGRVFVFDNEERQMLAELKKLSKDKSFDISFKEKLSEYENLNNDQLIQHFQHEFISVFDQIINSEKADQIQALFIVYDFYYHYSSSITCYGIQDYPIIVEPRYISSEYDYNKQILLLDNGINFQPAWVNCEDIGELDYLDISADLENLFKLHSRVLLHKAIDTLSKDGKLNFFRNRPFSFFINEHDCEVMLLYRLN